MRLFVAVEPPDLVRDQVAALVEELRRSAGDLRWTRRDQWHLTLAFLGEVDEARLGALQQRLARVSSRHQPLEVWLSGLGRFDGRVLWVGVDGSTDALKAMARAVAAAARKAGVDVEDRPYRPHVTLARSRGVVDLRDVVASVDDWTSDEWTARSFRLVRSHLGPHPSYETVAEWPLGASRSGSGSEASHLP